MSFDKTNLMDQSLWEAGLCAAYQEIPCLQAPVTGLLWTRCIHSTSSHLIFARYILILASHLCLGLPGDLFPLSFMITVLYAHSCQSQIC